MPYQLNSENIDIYEENNFEYVIQIYVQSLIELELLEVRLNELNPLVDKFILCESSTTHSGNPKPLYFDENKDAFFNFEKNLKYRDSIPRR